MAKGKATSPSGSTRPSRPALTPEGRENQLIALAVDLVEKRLREGTASSQETTHFLKLGSTEAQIKKRILEKEEDLITAKTEALKSQKRVEELYADALKAMREYSGQDVSDDEY